MISIVAFRRFKLKYTETTWFRKRDRELEVCVLRETSGLSQDFEYPRIRIHVQNDRKIAAFKFLFSHFSGRNTAREVFIKTDRESAINCRSRSFSTRRRHLITDGIGALIARLRTMHAHYARRNAGEGGEGDIAQRNLGRFCNGTDEEETEYAAFADAAP